MAGSNDSARNERLRSSVTRRQVLPWLGATAPPGSLAAQQADILGRRTVAKPRFVYVGTYTFPGTAPGGTHQSQAKGIYLFGMNASDGGLTPLQLQPFIKAPNPSYLALDPGLQHLYSVNEMTDGGVSAYTLNRTTGVHHKLTLYAVPTNSRALSAFRHRGGGSAATPILPL
jgi:hypothetical protein